MTVRKGASLINIMVFVMFAMMVTAQVFFYTATSFEGLTDEREIMSYRLMLDSIVRLASADLASNDYYTVCNGKISHDKASADYKSFYGNTQVKDYSKYPIKSWDIPRKPNTSAYSGDYHATIHDLDYEFDSTFAPEAPYSDGRTTWEKKKYNEANMYQKLFAAMNPPVMDDDITTDVDGNITVNYRYYLLRAYVDLPEKKFYGRKLMYQVLFRRSETDLVGTPHTVELKSFQEIWF